MLSRSNFTNKHVPFDGYPSDSSIHKDPDIDIYSCEICNSDSQFSMYICKSCLDAGAHKGHEPWLRLTKPG